MADPADLLNAWQEAIRELGGAAASIVSSGAGIAGEVLGPLQQQAQLVERVMERQLEFERELVKRATAPARAMLDFGEQTAAAFRAQANAFRTASTSFAQLADLLDKQAELAETATSAIRDPIATLRSFGAGE